jgi:hypothetical protein
MEETEAAMILSSPLAMTLSLPVMLTIGGLVAVVMIGWSFANWRAAIKVACVAVLLEGAIRKWALPEGQAQELAYFLKDIFLFGAYLKFFFSPDPELRAYRMKIPSWLIVALILVVSLSALNPGTGHPILAVYGLKIYFFYLPLIFMMPYLFQTKDEMIKQLTFYVLLAIPICILGFLQYTSDRFSVINTFASGMLETGAVGFGVGDRARITGTFSYLTGHTTFVIFFSTLTLVLLSLEETRMKWALMFLNLPLLAGNALMGGSRASIITLGFICVGFIMAAFSGRLGTSKNFITLLVGGVLVAAIASLFVFQDAWAHWSTRYQSSDDGFYTRVIGFPLKAMGKALDDGGVTGIGLGAVHPATQAIKKRLNLGLEDARSYDIELGQVMVELGPVGFACWYGLRFLLVWLGWRAFRESKLGVVRALSLASVLICAPYLIMSVIYNHTANFLICALTGFSLIPLLEHTPAGRQQRGGRVSDARSFGGTQTVPTVSRSA